MHAVDFIFNGRRLSDFGLIIANFGSVDSSFSGGDLEYNTVKTPSRDIYNYFGKQFNSPLSWDFSIVKNICNNDTDEAFTQYEESAIARWLLAPEEKYYEEDSVTHEIIKKHRTNMGYAWLQFDQDGYQDIWYKVVFQVKPKQVGGITYGFDLTATSNCGYGWTEEKVKTLKFSKYTNNYSAVTAYDVLGWNVPEGFTSENKVVGTQLVQNVQRVKFYDFQKYSRYNPTNHNGKYLLFVGKSDREYKDMKDNSVIVLDSYDLYEDVDELLTSEKGFTYEHYVSEYGNKEIKFNFVNVAIQRDTSGSDEMLEWFMDDMVESFKNVYVFYELKEPIYHDLSSYVTGTNEFIVHSDVDTYIHPEIKITNTSGDFYISNSSDLDQRKEMNPSRETAFKNINKTLLLDCDSEIIYGLNKPSDFNYYYPRLVNGENVFTTDSTDKITLEITYREPRRVIV